MLLALSRMRHASPVAVIAVRRLASVTTAGSGNASNSVAHDGTTGSTYENPFTEVKVPAAVVTTTSAGPGVPGGFTAVIVVGETTTKFVAGAPPMVTRVAPLR